VHSCLKCGKIAQAAHINAVTIGIAYLWRRRNQDNFFGF
jgi:hypothetical protein